MEVKLGPIVQKQLGVPEKKVQKSMTLEDLEKRWAEQRKWDKKHPVLASFKTAWWWIRYGIWNKIDDARYEVKWGFQRMFRGYDDPMVWGYWSENARLNVKILKALKKMKHGYPIVILNKREEKNWNLHWNKDDKKLHVNYEKRWNEIMDKMIAGWEAILKEDDVHIKTKGKYDHAASEVKRKELMKIFEEGMVLYTKHYRGLWD